MRGHCGIGIYHGKKDVNVGSLWRSAHALGADWMFTVGRRYDPQGSDTTKAWRHVPLLHFDDLDGLRRVLPREALLIGVELDPSAHMLADFTHPPAAVYMLGAEDHGLSNAARRSCHRIIRLPGRHCLNVAVAGSIVLYDRVAKAAA